MKLVPRLPREDVNRSPDGVFKTVSGLFLGAALIVGIVFVLMSFVVDFTVERLDPATEVSLFGDKVSDMMEAMGGEGATAASEEALRTIFDKVVQAGPELPYDFQLRIACQEAPNALALPGGGVIVTSGLLDIIETEEELAFILGHELGHFVHRDHLRGMGRSVAIQLAFGGMFMTSGIDPTIGLQLALEAMSSAHSREQEIAADETGLHVLALLSPDDVSGAQRALNALHSELEGGVFDAMDFTRSHPLGPERIAALANKIEQGELNHAKLRGTPLSKALKEACEGAEAINNSDEEPEEGGE